jgi:hypothetical protein
VSGTDEVMTNEGLIWILLIIATIWLATRAVRAWRRDSQRMDRDLPRLLCDHQWQTYVNTRVCLGPCGAREQIPYDIELAEGTDLGMWNEELR